MPAMIRKNLKMGAAAVLLGAIAIAVAAAKAPDGARAGGDPTTSYARVTLTSASGGGDSTSFVALEYDLEATAAAGRHQYGLFTVGRLLDFDPTLVGNFVANRQFASAQVDVLTPEGVPVAGYRLADVSIAKLKHSFRNGSLALEEAGLSFSSIEYDGFGPVAIRDANTPR
jgi:hypothetical protein